MLKQIVIISALLFGVEGQYRSRHNRKVDGNPEPPTRRKMASHSNASNSSNSSNATNATVTTTAAPTVTTTTAAPTKAPTTKAPTTTAAAKITKAPAKKTDAPAKKTSAAKETTAAATTAAGNSTNATTIPEAKVSTEITMTVKLDISKMNTAAKAAIGNSFAFGLHASACKGIKSLWTTLGQCMLGKGKSKGVTFGMAMKIDAKLVSTQPACKSATDCYGASTAAPKRELAAVSIKNGGTFEVTAKGKDVIGQAQTAQKALTAAKATLFDPMAIAKEVKAAMERPAMNKTLVAAGVDAAAVTAIVEAAKVAEVTTTVSKVQGSTPAPAATSDAYTAGVTCAIALVAGALLF